MTNPFDTRAQTWDDDPRRVRQTAEIFTAIERQVSFHPDWSTLDYGAGTGLLTLALAPRVRQVLAVDSSRGMLDILAQKLQARKISNVETLCADFAQDPAPAGPYHLITSAMTLHHVDDIPALLRIFFSQLARGGQIALADLDAEDGSFHGHAEGVHHAGFDRETLLRQLAACGFADVRFSTAARIEKNARAYTIFLVTARKP